MKGIGFFLRDVGFATGVEVSMQHLARILTEERVPFAVYHYKDDDDLVEQADACPYGCIDLQSMSFGDAALDRILAHHTNVVISIHSTMCNLQAEGDALARIAVLGDGSRPSLRFTCPSASETEGLAAFLANEWLYLPNTFSLPCPDSLVRERSAGRMQPGVPVRISLVCAFRPLKNMITQAAAVEMIAATHPVELHIFEPVYKTPVYQNLRRLTAHGPAVVVEHPQCDNAACFAIEGTFDLGLQVSLSETFSYVAFEHMIQGVPVVGSDSIPFANRIAKYSDVRDIRAHIEALIETPETYQAAERTARASALAVQAQNRADALRTVQRMMDRDA